MGDEINMIGGSSFGVQGSDIRNGYRLDNNKQVIPRSIESKILEECRNAKDSNACLRKNVKSQKVNFYDIQ